MRYNIVNLAADLVNCLGPFLKLGGRWHFILPPGDVLGTHFAVDAFSAAEGENSEALYGENLSSHHVEKISRHSVNLSTVPHRHAVFVKQVEILVGAVDKANIIFTASEKIKDFLFSAASVPHKSEVAADNMTEYKDDVVICE